MLKAWSPDGTVHTVTVEDSAGTYLACTDPSSTLEMLTIGDYTFIINKDVTVSAGTTESAALAKTAIVYIQYMDYSQTVSIYINGVMVAWHSSRDGAEAPQQDEQQLCLY